MVAAADLAQVNYSALRKAIFPVVPQSELYRQHYGRGLNMARIESAISQAEFGMMQDLTDLSAETTAIDPHLSSTLAKRFGALSAIDYDLTPAQGEGIDKAKALAICNRERRNIAKIRGFRQAIYQLAWGRFHGRAALETHWGFGSGGEWAARSLGWIHPRRLSFGPERELRVVDAFQRIGYFQPAGFDLREMPGKFITWTPQTFCEYPEREGLAPRCLYWSFFKRFAARQRMILTELFGIPWRIVELEKDAPVQKEQLDSIAEKAEALGGTTTAAFPPGVKLRVERPESDSGEFFEMTIDGVDRQISKLVLGQTGTTDAEGNRAESVVHQAQQDVILQLDGNGLTEAFQEQLIEVSVFLNDGPEMLSHAPRFQLRTQPPRDREKELVRVEKVISFGVPVAADEVYEISGLRKPANDEAQIVKAETTTTDPFGNPITKGPMGKIVEPGAETEAGGFKEVDADDAAASQGDLEEGGVDQAAANALKDLLGMSRELPWSCMRLLELACSEARSALELAPSRFEYGSPDVLVERGVAEGSNVSASWAERFVDAAGGTSATNLHTSLAKAANGLDLERMARALERRVLHSLMLGALDSDFEANEEIIVPVVRFDVGRTGFVTKPFAEAIRFFLQKQVMPRRAFDRLAAEAKRRAFTIAGLARDEMLTTAHAELSRAIAAGDDLSTFRKALGDRFESAGWTRLNSSHVETVFRNGVMGAYASGRHAQMTQPAVLEARPFWQVLGVNDDRTRPHHHAAHNKVLRHDDPFWKRSPLPWGHNCRCRKVSRSKKDLDRLGLQVVSGAELVGLPDDGWDSSVSLIG